MQPIIFTAHVTPNTDNVRTISSCSAAGLGLQTWLQKKPKKKKYIPVSVSRAQRGGAPPSDPPLKFRRPVCVSISREHKGELLQHMETEMDGKMRRYFQKMGQPQELKNETNVQVGKTAVPLGATCGSHV